jgi:hypothetical protein
MCYSLKVSLVSWFISLFACLFLFHRNHKYDRWIATFVIIFSQIQILESLLWMSYNRQTETFENPQRTQLVLFVMFYALWFQPTLNFFGAYLSTGNRYALIGTGFYLLVMSYLTTITKQNTWSVTVGPHGHLVWHRLNTEQESHPTFVGSQIFSYIYALGLFLPLIFIQDQVLLLTLGIYGLVTMVYLRLKYPQEWSSLWCLISVVLPCIAIVVNK